MNCKRFLVLLVAIAALVMSSSLAVAQDADPAVADIQAVDFSGPFDLERCVSAPWT